MTNSSHEMYDTKFPELKICWQVEGVQKFSEN